MRAFKQITLSVTKDMKPLLVGQCILDTMGQPDTHVIEQGLHLSYN